MQENNDLKDKISQCLNINVDLKKDISDRDSRIGNLELKVQDLDSNKPRCNMCDFKGKTMPGLKTHMTVKHASELNSKENTQTQVALKEFDEKVNHNPADKIYSCEKCNIKFVSKKHLSKHDKAMHRASLIF